jgi:hypothetical protein
MLKGLSLRAIDRMAHRISRQVGQHLFREPIVDHILGTQSLATFDVRKFAQIVAGLEAGEFYCKHLYNANFFESHVEHVAEMARRAVKLGPGMILEFGVASGLTLTAIANASGRNVIGFDSFKGLPRDWRTGVQKGAFACAPPKLPGNASLRIGMIEDTLPALLRDDQSEINLLHIDTDLYEVAKFILTQCQPRIRDTIVIFDEFFNFPGWRDHEYKALTEFEKENEKIFDINYIGLGGAASVSLRITRK